MDATAAVVILIFVISIFSGMRSNQGYKPPSPPPTLAPTTGVVYPEVTVIEPPANYAAVDPVLTQDAIIKYIQKYRSQDLAVSIAVSIMRHSAAFDVNPKLVAALMARESKFNPRALSSSGAMGLGQLLPSTAKNLGVEDGFDVDQNTYGTVRYLRSLLDRFNRKVSMAIAAYLEGPNAVTRQGGFSDHTKTYVEDILNIYQKI